MAVEHRDKTTTEGKGLGHSWADDNVARGDSDVDFIKRRPKFPLGDDPRGREIDFTDTTGKEAYGSTRNQVFRAYRGKAPIEGQPEGMSARKGKIFQNVRLLRPELPNKSTDDIANAGLQASQTGARQASGFKIQFPTVGITSPAPGATFSPGDTLTVIAPASALRNLHSAVLELDGVAVARRVLDRRDQDSTTNFEFRFIHPLSPVQALGPMSLTVRVFNMETANRGFIADDALGTRPDIRGATGTLDGHKGSATSSNSYQLQLNETGYLVGAGGIVSININII